MQLKQIIILSLCLFYVNIAHTQNSAQLSPEEIEAYSEQSEMLVKYLEGTLNFLGDKSETASEKDIIINESYLKVFVDENVQIEDDLDENREIALSKDVQAYLKDVDFFFKKVNFNFEINSVENFVNEKGQIYFKLVVDRNIEGITIEDDTVNNNQLRYFEINLNYTDKDLKIASIYTTLPNKKKEIAFWWNNMAESWKGYFGKSILIYDTLPFNNIISVNDSSLVIYKWHETIIADTFLIMNDDTVQYSHIGEAVPGDLDIFIDYNTLIEKLPDTVYTNTNEIYEQIERFRALKIIDISNSILIGNLRPLSELTKLEDLRISNTLIDDLTPLRNLNGLKKLNCSGTPVEILEPLRYASSLMDLNLSYTPLVNIEAISNLKNLESLNLSYTQVNNFTSLNQLQKLNLLIISGLEIDDNSGLNELTQLTNLIASSSNLSLPLIKDLENLQHLNIDSTSISDLDILSDLTNLSVLQANNSKVDDLSPLLNLPELRLVYCDNSMINKQEAQLFIEKKPDCMVIYNTFEIVNWWNTLSEEWHSIAYSRMELSNPITKEQLHVIISIKSVDLANMANITDLSPLRMLYRLETLNVEGCSINNIEALNTLHNLKKLNIDNTKVNSLEPLSNNTNLKYLHCENTEITDLSPLKSNNGLEIVYADNSNVEKENVLSLMTDLPECLVIYQSQKLNMWWDNLNTSWQNIFLEKSNISSNPNREQLQQIIDSKKLEINNIDIHNLEVLSLFDLLEELNVTNTMMMDISAVTYLPKLKTLTIANNPVSSIAQISKLTSLENLNIENTSVDDLTEISQLKNLRYLNIAGTKVKSLKHISGLTNLEVLVINNTKIRSLKYIENIRNLQELRCYNSGIKSSVIEKFKASHPNCEVIYY